MWEYSPKSAKICIFGINLPQKGYTPKAIFIKFGLREGVSGLHPHEKFHCCDFKNVGLQPPKSQKMVTFGINFPLRENSGGPQKKVEYR